MKLFVYRCHDYQGATFMNKRKGQLHPAQLKKDLNHDTLQSRQNTLPSISLLLDNTYLSQAQLCTAHDSRLQYVHFQRGKKSQTFRHLHRTLDDPLHGNNHPVLGDGRQEEEGEKMDERKIESDRKTSICNMLTDKGRITRLLQLSFRSCLLYSLALWSIYHASVCSILLPFALTSSLAIFFSLLLLATCSLLLHAAQSSFRPGHMHKHTLQ